MSSFFTNQQTKPNLRIGSSYAGGIVFYLDQTGRHGLVCAPYDQGTLWWGCNRKAMLETSRNLGRGRANTSLLVSRCRTRTTAARECHDLWLYGYTDWYLPSIEELKLMFYNLHARGVGNFNGGFYWSSTEYNPALAIAFDFQFFTFRFECLLTKNYYCHVRAVRSF